MVNFKVYNKGPKTAEVLIYDTIGDSWFGGISAKDFAAEIKNLGELDEIIVRINSEGGNVFDGIAIYNTLYNNSANITVHIDGLAASIASIIAMAGNTVHMADNAWMMIHDPWTLAMGGADDLRRSADLMDNLKTTLVNTYAKKTAMDKDEISNLMTEETWMDSSAALEKGFVDNLTEELQIAACIKSMEFKHVPEQVAKKEFIPVASDRIKLMRAKLNARKLR